MWSAHLLHCWTHAGSEKVCPLLVQPTGPVIKTEIRHGTSECVSVFRNSSRVVQSHILSPLPSISTLCCTAPKALGRNSSWGYSGVLAVSFFYQNGCWHVGFSLPCSFGWFLGREWDNRTWNYHIQIWDPILNSLIFRLNNLKFLKCTCFLCLGIEWEVLGNNSHPASCLALRMYTHLLFYCALLEAALQARCYHLHVTNEEQSPHSNLYLADSSAHVLDSQIVPIFQR